MKQREKRTTTEPGLGKVSEASRKASISDAPVSGAPISAPPASGAPMSARHTRAIESITPEERKAFGSKPTQAVVEVDRPFRSPPRARAPSSAARPRCAKKRRNPAKSSAA